MEFLAHPYLLISLLVLIALHVLAAVLYRRRLVAKILNYVNIGLHIALLPLLAYMKLTIEEAVLFYMISIFSYTLIFAVLHASLEKRGR